MPQPVIQLHNVWKTYRSGTIEFTALRGIDLEIARGEFTAVMGPSGSGKSTLMNILGCLDTKDEGDYILNGIDIRDMDRDELARIRNREIGFVFQSFNLLPRLTVVENVELPLVYADFRKRERRERAMELLDAVGLTRWANHRPGEISGGQRQRVAIARATVCSPALLLADEPTGNLDSGSSAEIMRLFQSLNEAGSTILLVTHEADIAAYASRIVHVVDGRITDDLRREVSHVS
ncbi:MAG: ABC transporter ATP-binding protein [Clostridia bacterium]|nr:ABC transporter ATP-binding protein [Clostridia bacterium]